VRLIACHADYATACHDIEAGFEESFVAVAPLTMDGSRSKHPFSSSVKL
jgi:hypothetical protein